MFSPLARPNIHLQSAAVAAAMLAIAGLAQAQSRGNDNRNGVPAAGGAPAAAPRPVSGLGGVSAQGSRPMSGLGGVHAQGARPLSGINPPKMSLPGPLPGLGGVPAAFPGSRPISGHITDPNFKPVKVGPWPGVDNTPPQSGGGHGGDGHNPHEPVIVVPRTGDHFDFGGAHAEDMSNLHLHLGLNDSAFVVPAHGHHHHHHGGFPPYVVPPWWYSDGIYGLYAGWFNPGYPTVQGFYADVDPSLYANKPTEPQTTAPTVSHPSNERELGDLYLQGGDAKNAAASYRVYLRKHPDDAPAMRALGLSLLTQSQTKEGVATIAMAYKTDPSLADAPFSADVFAGGAKDLREQVRRASIYANRTKGAAEWLTVAVLMQAEGRDDMARTMLDRASAAGLDPNVAIRLRQTLSH